MKEELLLLRKQLKMGHRISFAEAMLLQRAIDILVNNSGNSPAIPDAARDALEKALTAMEFMGDTLNNLDAVCSEDVEFVTPAFDAVRRVLAAAPQEVKGE